MHEINSWHWVGFMAFILVMLAFGDDVWRLIMAFFTKNTSK